MKTQIQLPDEPYREAKRVAREREMSLAEVVRRGVEYIVRACPPVSEARKEWLPPKPHRLGRFKSPVEEWRVLATEEMKGMGP